MINSFLNTTKTIENSTKICHSNCICHRERRFNNGKNDAHILRNIRQKNEYNNHRFYMGNEKDDSKITNLSEMYSKIHKWDLYKSNSKPKKQENEILLSIKTKNHNYHNITTYHSYEKKEKIYERNTFDNKNSNNINLIENEAYTPRLNNKSKNIVYEKNSNDFSKTMNNFKNRDNYGYHEIKDVKNNNNVNRNNNNSNQNNKIKSDRKYAKKNIPNYLSINFSNNNSFRCSLNIKNNTGISNNANNNTNTNNNNNANNYNTKNNIKKNELNNINNVNDTNKNSNQRKNSYLNFKTAQNYFNPPKNIIKEETNNYSSYKNIKEPKEEIKNEKPKINENNRNLNKSLLRKIYIKSTPEDKRPKNCIGSRVNIIKRNNLMNTNILFNNKENDKNIINSNRFLSGEFKEIVKDEKKDKIINRITNTEKKMSNSKIPTNKINKINEINKMYSPIKKENSKIINHLKQNSYLNCNTNSTEKKVSKRNEKYEINHIFKKVEKNNVNKTTRKNKNEKINETKIPNAHRINEKTLKVNLKDNNNNSIILQTNDSLRRLKEKASQKININKEKDEIQKTNSKNKNTNIYMNTYIKKIIINNNE